MTELLIGGHSVRLKAFHDLSFVTRHGRVFSVFDQHSCGMLGFGLITDEGRRIYLKYAGAPTLNYPSDPSFAIEKLRIALPRYQALRHPALIRLLYSEETPHGLLGVFEWAEGLALGPHQDGFAAMRAAPLVERLRMFDRLCDLHLRAEELGLAIAGLSDAKLIYEPSGGRLTLISIDEYLSLPSRNLRGRIPGSPLYLPPEGYRVGNAIDETSNVYALAALSHCLFGDRADKTKEAWQAPEKLYEVARRGLEEDRGRRQQSTAEFLSQWREAVRSSRLE